MLERIRRTIEELELIILLADDVEELKKHTEKLRLCVLLLKVEENLLEEYVGFIEEELDKLD